MKSRLIFTLVALTTCSFPIAAGATTYDTALATRMQGRILLQVESHGEAWYIRSKDLKRYYMKDGSAAYSIMRFFSQGIADVDLAKIPQVANTAAMKASSSACATNTLGNRFRGEILLQVQQHGEAWYVDPVKCRAIYMKDGAVAYEVMRFLGFGVFTRDLEKIQDGGTVAGTGGALSSTPSPLSCPTNSHQNPSGASNCLCDTGYETNAAKDGCAIVSTPASVTIDSGSCIISDNGYLDISGTMCQIGSRYARAYSITATGSMTGIAGAMTGPPGTFFSIGTDPAIPDLHEEVFSCGGWETDDLFHKCYRQRQDNSTVETTQWSLTRTYVMGEYVNLNPNMQVIINADVKDSAYGNVLDSATYTISCPTVNYCAN